MKLLSKEFAKCLISASNFTAERNMRENALKYVSISKIDNGHQICATDGFVMASYKITEDMNINSASIEGYADFSDVKIKKGSAVTSASIANISGLQGILINFINGKKADHVFVPVVNGIEYPKYTELLKYNKYGSIKSYGRWEIYPQKFYNILNCLNLQHIDTIALRPTETDPLSKIAIDNALECGVILDKKSPIHSGVFNIPGVTALREIVTFNDGKFGQLNGPRYVNPSLLLKIMKEASAICKSTVQFNMAGKIDPIHIEGFSDGSSSKNFRQEIYAHYLLMPMNRA